MKNKTPWLILGIVFAVIATLVLLLLFGMIFMTVAIRTLFGSVDGQQIDGSLTSEMIQAYVFMAVAGLAALVDQLCDHAKYFAVCLSGNGFIVPNDVVFNQILVQCESPEKTRETLAKLQNSGKLWCGGTVWQGLPAIRISVCSWQTTREDIDDCVQTFVDCRD